MKTRKLLWSTLTAAAVFAATWLGAAPGRAQTGEFPPPEATPIPLNEPVAPDAPGEAAVRPQAVEAGAVSWLPSGGYVRLDGNRNVTVTAVTGNPLDFTFARIALHVNGNILPALAYSATIVSTSTVGGVSSMTITAQIPVTLTSSTLKFSVKEAGTLVDGEFRVGYPVYVPTTLRDFEWPPLNQDTLEAVNDNQCTIGAPLALDRTYNGTFKSTTDSDWAYVDVGSTANLQITAANVPTPSQMQVYVSSGGTCGGIVLNTTVPDKANPSVTLSGLSGGRVYIRMVAAMVAVSSQRYTLRVSSSSFEDNDTPCQATPTVAGTTYTTQIDDTYDFFELRVTQTGTLSMTVFNHAHAGDFQLRSPVVDSNCSPTASTQRLEFTTIVNDRANIQRFVTPGVYYARMFYAAVPTTTKTYNFVWNVTPGAAGPANVCVGDVSNKTCFGDSPGGTVPVWWQGLNGNARIKLTFDAMTGTKCPVPGTKPTMEFVTTAVNGNRTLSVADNPNWRLDQGGYKVIVEAFDAASGAVLYRNGNGQAVKVDCNFRPADAEPEPAP